MFSPFDFPEPSPPPAPVVLPVPEKQKQNQGLYPLLLQLDLLPASTKYGPIHGYELQFFVVLPHETKSGKIKHPIQHQLGVPFGAQNSLQDATSATEAVNFAYHMYKSGSLPTRVNISTGLVGRALKQDTTYSAVLLAYTNDTVSSYMVVYNTIIQYNSTHSYKIPFIFSLKVCTIYKASLQDAFCCICLSKWCMQWCVHSVCILHFARCTSEYCSPTVHSQSSFPSVSQRSCELYTYRYIHACTISSMLSLYQTVCIYTRIYPLHMRRSHGG